MISKKQEQDEKNSSLAESNVFFFKSQSPVLQEEREEGGRGRRERERGVVGVGRKAQSHTHTHRERERERERENERGDVRLFYDKNFVRIGVICNCSSSFTQNFLEK